MKVKTRSLSKTIAISALAAALAASAAGCGQSALQRHQQRLIESGKTGTQPIKGMALSIRPRKEAFTSKEPILIDVKLTNITNTLRDPWDVNVYTEIGVEGLLLYLELFTVNGQRKQAYTTDRIEASFEQRMQLYPHYTKLQPGFFVGRPLQFQGFQPGIYELTVMYANDYELCRLSPGLSPDQIHLIGTEQGLVQLWRGILRSNTIVFEVLPE